VCQEPYQQWQHPQISRTWEHLPAFFQNDDLSSPSAQQTCKQCELCDNPAQVHIQHRFGLEVQDNHLDHETSCFHWWAIFAVTSHVATTNIFDRYVLDIEAHIVPRKSLTESFTVHFNRLDFSCNIDWSKGHHHARLKNTSLHLAHWDNTNTTSFVGVLPDARAYQLEALVADCNPELQAVWFHWHSHLYG
uniref:Uncharacterized protein n=1 Tax=Canis lupus familiaris TaxID=9615 RepID=A0A8P0PR52_CANLF